MREYNADGLILCPAEGTTTEQLAQLAGERWPCVLVSRYVPGLDMDYVSFDNRGGMYRATGHLVEGGHRRIAMIGGKRSVSTGQDRHQGYLDALTDFALPESANYIIDCPPTRENGVKAVGQLLALREPPTAAVCFNDIVAFGVMLGLRQHDIELGRDFALVGFDDVAEASLWTPGLSSVRLDTDRLGAAAADLLMQRIEGYDAPPQRIIMDPELIARGSSRSA